MKKIKSVLIGLLILVLMLQILLHISKDDIDYNMTSRDYYVKNGFNETGSKNLVTAIYLDYRFFDSFFEASLLLVVVTGIAFVAVKDEDLF